MKKNRKNEVSKAVEFTKAAVKACKDAEKTYEFKCPICGGTARARKVELNGHIRAKCNNCGFSLIE